MIHKYDVIIGQRTVNSVKERFLPILILLMFILV